MPCGPRSELPARGRLREVARRCGVSHGAPRRHFPTLALLLAATAAWAAVHGVASLTSRGALDLVGTRPQELLDQLLPQD